MPRLLLLLTLTFVVFIAYTTPVEACLNGVMMEQDEAAKKVRLAEKALEKGENRRASRLLQADHYMFDGALRKRVRLVKAIAALRQGKTKRAERVLRNMLKKDTDNPLLRTRLAEALHKRKGDDAGQRPIHC